MTRICGVASNVVFGGSGQRTHVACAGSNRGENLSRLASEGESLTRTLNLLLSAIECRYPEMLCSLLLLEADGIHVRHAAAPRLPLSFTRAIDGAAIGPCAGSCGTAAYRRHRRRQCSPFAKGGLP